jgi:hypothetical protein
VTDEEIQALGLNFTCAGCGRPEASVVTKLNHERHCNYLKLAQYWDNPNDEDGEWPVDKVLSVRGPPGRRFVQLQWRGTSTTPAVVVLVQLCTDSVAVLIQ